MPKDEISKQTRPAMFDHHLGRPSVAPHIIQETGGTGLPLIQTAPLPRKDHSGFEAAYGAAVIRVPANSIGRVVTPQHIDVQK